MNGTVLERAAAQPPGLGSNEPGAPPPFAAPIAGLRRLAAFHAAEPTVEFLAALRAAPLRAGFGIALDRDDALQAMALIDEVVSDLPDPIGAADAAPLRADFAAIHRTQTYHAGPLETDWCAGDGGQPAPDLTAVLRRWRQHAGLAPDAVFPPDHLVSELTLLTALLERGQAPDATLFLDQHPLRWVPAFCSRVATRCREPFYAGVAILTAAHLDHLRDLLAGICGLPRPAEDDGADTRRRRWAEGRLPRTCGCDG